MKVNEPMAMKLMKRQGTYGNKPYEKVSRQPNFIINRSMVFVLYFMLIHAFDKKSAPRMRSYVQFSASNTRALIFLIFFVFVKLR